MSWVLPRVYGTEYQKTVFTVAPLVLTDTFQTFVTMTTTYLVGGAYAAKPFFAAVGSNANAIIEARITVQRLPGPVIFFQTLTVSQSYTGAGDTLPFLADIPVDLVNGVYEIVTELRHPDSPGGVISIQGGTQLLRVA